jgi:hypothetical protein
MVVRFIEYSGMRGFMRGAVDVPLDLIGALATIVKLADEISPELTPPDFEKQMELSAGLANIKASLTRYYAQGSSLRLHSMSRFGGKNAVGMIHDALSGIPDAVPASESKDLEFIEDNDLTSIRK